MELQMKSSRQEDYLEDIENIIDIHHPFIQEKLEEIVASADSLEDRARIAFDFVRDEIDHSFDTGSSVITISAVETLARREGICFAKAHLLAGLLRGMGIPTGFCYQRVLRKGTLESGYALHGLNAAYLEGHGWFRIDPRGNKPGISSEFSIHEEKLPYDIREEMGEIDYPYVYAAPLESVIRAMEESEDCQALFSGRPEEIA